MSSAPWRRAPAHEQGRARCVSVRMGRWGAGRRRQAHEQGPAACGALGDAALPCRARGAAGVRGSTLFALRAKALQSGAPDHGVSRKEARFRNVSPIKGFPGAPGNGLLPARSGVFPARRNPYALPMSLSPQETEIRPISPSKHALPPAKPSTFIHPWQTRPVTSRVSSPPHFAANIQRAPKPSFRAFSRPLIPQKAISPPFPPPPHPPKPSPPGDRRALPAPAQGSRPLRIPFWEAASVFPPVSRPPKRRRRTAPARGPSAVYALCRRTETKRSKSAPCSWGGRASNPSQRHWPPALPPCPHPLKGPDP